MPYIKREAREELGMDWQYIEPIDAGELNYMVTSIVRNYLGLDPHYKDFNDVIGVLEAAKLELYRRMVAPYEDKKMQDNGDVYF